MTREIYKTLEEAEQKWPPIENKNSQDLTNQVYGNFTGIYRTQNCSNDVCWVWQCKCGNYIKKRSRDIKGNKIKSCGCIKNHTNLIDLTGQRIGRWTVLSQAPNRNKAIYWVCQCDCGTIKEVKSQSLLQGDSKSCGCLQKDLLKEREHKAGEHTKNLEGQFFGDLKVEKLIGVKDYNNKKLAKWLCKCSCGNTIEVFSIFLLNGKKTHCGCKNIISYGENKIKDILLKNNILFIQQASTELKCKYPNSQTSARFDFYVNNSYIIEYDGETHFEENIGNGWITKEKYLYTYQHDQFKNQWCKENNIPLIRIPYTHYNDLCLEDLIPETSQFLLE